MSLMDDSLIEPLKEESVDNPNHLAELAKTVCNNEGIEYTEPHMNQGSWNRPLALNHGSTGPIPLPAAIGLQETPKLNQTSTTIDYSTRNRVQCELSGTQTSNNMNPSSSLEQPVFENASSQKVAEMFNKTWHPLSEGKVDCLVSLEVSKWSVEWVLMVLFSTKLKWANQVQHLVLNNGVTLIIPNSEVTLKGVTDEVIVSGFGPEIHDAITKNPIHRKELAEGIHVTESSNAFLCFLNFSVGHVQLSTGFNMSLSIWYTDKLRELFFPGTVILNDSNVASLPVYHLSSAGNHGHTVLLDILEVYRRIEGFRYEGLINYEMKKNHK
ncbi:conserved hypothetical protein [Histoplasma capsulatum var. duboisii H88]|uniref:Uncharacterized protein n=2 Tax=Ajellomyces capsulatus TaxID=5037 RepID=F0UBK0_AJEC8|nr:conserved hypothetical protein [Histoplasma capsulatum H143]EGC43056.1 conserved hypothetical protein [Histoplasma capsulatum var. duboisii H88]